MFVISFIDQQGKQKQNGRQNLNRQYVGTVDIPAVEMVLGRDSLSVLMERNVSETLRATFIRENGTVNSY
jgi:hypothetical protein